MPSGSVAQQVEQTVRVLPPAAQGELLHFLNYLQYKYQTGRPSTAVKLGGLWADVDLDINEEDVHALRQRVTARVLTRIGTDGLSS